MGRLSHVGVNTINVMSRDIANDDGLFSESDYFVDVETRVEPYNANEFVFDKNTDTMLLTEALKLNSEESNCNSLNKAIKVASEITGVRRGTLRDKFVMANNLPSEFLHAIKFETRELGVNVQIEWTSELRRRALSLVLAKLKDGTSPSIKAASRDVATELTTPELKVSASTIELMMTPNSKNNVAAIVADESIEDLIDAINSFKNERNRWTPELRREVLERVIEKLPSLPKTVAAEAVADDYIQHGRNIKGRTICAMWNVTSHSYAKAVKDDSEFLKLIEILNKENELSKI